MIQCTYLGKKNMRVSGFTTDPIFSSDPNRFYWVLSNRFYWVLSKYIKLARPTIIKNANLPENRISPPFLLADVGIQNSSTNHFEYTSLLFLLFAGIVRSGMKAHIEPPSLWIFLTIIT